MVNWAITKRPAVLLGLNLAAAACYLLVGWRTGFLAHIDASVFSTPDSHDYRSVADWIYGARSSSAASIWRPFLYPLLLGLSDRAAGTTGVWLLNVGLWFGALNAAAIATYRFVRSTWVAALVFLALAANISLILLTFEALTEITALALTCAWILGLSVLSSPPTPRGVILVLLPLSLLVLVKPEFEILLVATALVVAVGVMRSPARSPGLAALAACLVPVAIQVALMVRVNHYWGISEVGDSTIRGYYLPRMLTYLGRSSDVYAGRAQAIAMSNADVVRLVAGHPFEAVRVFGSILKGNLESGSNFLTSSSTLTSIDTITNQLYAFVLVAMIPIVAAALWRSRDVRLALLCLGALNVFLAAGLSFWQGDRLTVIAIPLWGIALVLALKQVLEWVRGRRSAAEPPAALRTAGAAED